MFVCHRKGDTLPAPAETATDYWQTACHVQVRLSNNLMNCINQLVFHLIGSLSDLCNVTSKGIFALKYGGYAD